MKELIFAVLTMVLLASVTNAATDDEKKDCLQYDKPVTLTGTVFVRKVDFGPGEPSWWSGSFPLIALDKPICTWGPDEESERMEWALHVVDTCSRVWPATSRVQIVGTLFHANTVHHHSKVLIMANKIVRLDGRLPACAKESNR
jgi:Domain of unknown function (DUF4431)